MNTEKQQPVRYQTTVNTENEKTKVDYYQTTVVEFDDEQIVLNNGGWWTKSTQARMNWASREYELGFLVHRKGKTWHVKFFDKIYPYESEKIRLDRKTRLVMPFNQYDMS